MSERAVFLDRDNTIIENDGYLGDPAKVKLLPGAAMALASLRALGYRLVVVSNQSGVARGMFTEADVDAVNNEMARQLREQGGAYVDAFYYCPYHPEAPISEYRVDHEWRKPKAGMLKQAAVDFQLDLVKSWMIGDAGRDIAAGATAGCRTILLRDTNRGSKAAEDDGADSASPGFVVKSLADAARIIAREGRSTPRPEPVPKVELKEEPPLPEAVATPPELPPELPPEPTPIVQPRIVQRVEEPRVEEPPPSPAYLAVPAPVSSPEPSGATAEPGRFEKNLDELVTLLRHQQRNAELRPDFSLSTAAALLIQTFAIIALVIGLANHFTAKVTIVGPGDQLDSLNSRLAAELWVMVSVALQGMVVALMVYGRQK